MKQSILEIIMSGKEHRFWLCSMLLFTLCALFVLAVAVNIVFKYDDVIISTTDMQHCL